MKEPNHLEQRDEAFIEALAPIINKLIDKNYETSKDKIASQMAPLIGSAIREQIKNQKDDVVDALYPVMGNMISRYVSKSLEEMLESINQKIQDGLSVNTLKRKLKAKIKGISETELLLQENSSTHIKAVLLIHKETGIVLTQAYNMNSTIDEPEMVASMMTAIRSFINDWVDKNEKDSEVGEIDYGGSKIVLENGGYSYLAVIVDGATYNKTYDTIRKTLENIVIDYGDEIRNFNGDFENFPTQAIKEKLLPLLSTENNNKIQKNKKLHPILFFIPILLISLFSWKFYENYEDKQLLNNINTTLYKTPQLTIYRINAIKTDNQIILHGEVPTKYHKELALKVLSKIKTDKKIQNNLVVIKNMYNPNEIDLKISYILKGLNTQKCLNISYIYNYDELTLLGESCNIKKKQEIITLLKENTKIKNIKDKIKIIHPNINLILYFKKASFRIDETQKLKLLEFSKKLKKLNQDFTIIINGYSDNTGTMKSRKSISLKRAKNIASILKKEFLIKQKIKTKADGKAPKGININKSPYKARCSIISLEFREN